MRKLIETNPGEDGLIKSVAGAAAADFLRLQLNKVEDKIKTQEDHFEHFRLADNTVQPGSQALLEVYQQEKILFEGLLKESQSEIFINLLFRNLDRVERQISDDLWKRPTFIPLDENSKRIRRERELLKNMLIEWKRWVGM